MSSIESPELLRLAVREGNLEVVKYLVSKNIPMYVVDLKRTNEANRLNPGKKYTLYLNALNIAIEEGHLDCMKYLYDKECECNSISISKAVSYGRLDFLKYLTESNYDWNQVRYRKNIVTIGLGKKQAECVRYFIEREWDKPVKVHLSSWKDGEYASTLLSDAWWKNLLFSVPEENLNSNVKQAIAEYKQATKKRSLDNPDSDTTVKKSK
jgi:hypothetical protein